MAETAVAALIKVIFQKLADEAFKKYVRSQGIYSELNQLGSTLSHIQALLNDASHKEVIDESVGLWLNDLQHLAYDIDDILDDVATEAMIQDSGALASKVRKIIPTCCTSFSLSQSLHHKLDSITKKLHNLENQKGYLGLIVKHERRKSYKRGNESSLLESYVIGRESEKEKMLNNLLQDEPSKEKFSILPIVGMGGVGKTTLARLLYNDIQVKGRFEIHAWVCVSDDFDISKISKTIFQAVSGENKEFEDLNLLQMALKEKIKDKRFLLVLDDVWSENYDDWETLMLPFYSGACGSKVIMTSRKEQLLKMLGFDHLDHLHSLSSEDALSLFALHALGVDNFDSYPTLGPKGERIVEKCGGLPLALKAIGRLLRANNDEEKWDDVLNSKIWDSKGVGDLSTVWKIIIPALKLSYHDLSADLKRLFAYCSLFPKNFLFDKEELVLLWLAEGFLNKSNETKSSENLGNEYFEELLSRSFFQHAPHKESLFVMHDLMNDFATFVARDSFLRFDKQTEMVGEALEKYRHISFAHERYVAYQKFDAFKRAKGLRTLLAVSVGVGRSWDTFYLSSKLLVDLLPELPFLRVLSISCFEISVLPDIIGRLKHLRYLNVSRTQIKELPENVGNLYNLQTLIVFGCHSLARLPKSILKLKKLQHFDMRDTPSLKKMPSGIGELKSLCTLPKVIIGGDDDFTITEFKGLLNLRGEISIEGLQNVKSAMHAREANLSLKRLTKLEMKWGDGYQRGRLEKEVLNELKPHTDTLKFFNIKSYSGIEFPDWVGDPSFYKLVHVSIRDCKKCVSLPPLGQLPSLKELFIKGMDGVKVISSELTRTSTSVSFRSLETLKFKNMSGWEEWSTNSEVMFPCLRELQIKKCPNLINISLQALPSLRVLIIHGCGDGVLRCLVRAALLITKLEIRSISGLTDEVWKAVVENLGAIEEVRIKKCNEIRYLCEPGTEEVEDSFGSNPLSSLRTLKISSCDNIEHCCCPNSIERLDISSCKSVRCVSFPKVTGGGGQKLKSLSMHCFEVLMEKINNTSMPMLEKVYIYGWRNLKSIIQFTSSVHLTEMHILGSQSMTSFPDTKLPNLTTLRISYCESMESFHDFQLPNLTHLHIAHCDNIKEFCDFHLPNLTHWIIEYCQNLGSFSDIRLPNLTHMYIESCKNIKSFCDIHTPNLISWRIDYCPNLESFPDLHLSNLTMLKHMCIKYCPMMDASFPRGVWPPNLCTLEIGKLKRPISDWGDQNFPASLVHLRLCGEPHLRNFSQLSDLFPSSLTQLQIVRFDKLESLSTGLQHLTSLQHLDFENCPMIKHLPETLLPSLLSLSTYKCPKLEEKCNGRGSHYWPLISHIPCIDI